MRYQPGCAPARARARIARGSVGLPSSCCAVLCRAFPAVPWRSDNHELVHSRDDLARLGALLAAMGEAASEGADAAEARGSDESSARRLVGYNSIVNHDPIVAVLALQ